MQYTKASSNDKKWAFGEQNSDVRFETHLSNVTAFHAKVFKVKGKPVGAEMRVESKEWGEPLTADVKPESVPELATRVMQWQLENQTADRPLSIKIDIDCTPA